MPNPHLPRETIDHIIDLLHDEPETLKECCIAKPRIPRTRSHLFANVKFTSVKDLESWKKTFPDPSNSPSYHTHTLVITHTRTVVEADTRMGGGLIQNFSRIVRLKLTVMNTDKLPRVVSGNLERIPFTPFYTFAFTLKSLHVNCILLPCPQTLNLVRSFPLLEDLSLIGRNGSFGDGGGHDPRGSHCPSDLAHLHRVPGPSDIRRGGGYCTLPAEPTEWSTLPATFVLMAA